MESQSPNRRLLAAVILTLPLALSSTAIAGKGGNKSGGGSSSGSEASPVQYSGRATGLIINTNLLDLAQNSQVFADTDELDSNGGSKDVTQFTIEQAPTNDTSATTGILSAATMGGGNVASSVATADNFELFATASRAEVSNSADGNGSVLQAYSEAVCNDKGEVILSGGSDIANLTVNDQPVEHSGEPNQTVVDTPLLKIVVNEQIYPYPGAIQVTALHITEFSLLGSPLNETIVARAKSDIVCSSDPGFCSSPADFVTGGGRIPGAGDRHASFGFHGGIKPNGSLSGHLNVVDHGTGQHIQGSSVVADSYSDPSPISDTRQLTYNATVDGVTAACAVTTSDNGEPGRNDFFGIVCSAGDQVLYSAQGTLAQGGNIQLHTPACSSSGDSTTSTNGNGGTKGSHKSGNNK